MLMTFFTYNCGALLGMMVMYCLYWHMCRTGYYDFPDIICMGDGVVLNSGEMEKYVAYYTSVTDPMDYGKHDI